MVALSMTASGIGAEKSIEQVREYFGIDAVSAVADTDQHAVLINGPEVDLDDRAISRVSGGVPQQV